MPDHPATLVRGLQLTQNAWPVCTGPRAGPRGLVSSRGRVATKVVGAVWPVVARLADPPAVLELSLRRRHAAVLGSARKGAPAEHVRDTEPYGAPLLMSLR